MAPLFPAFRHRQDILTPRDMAMNHFQQTVTSSQRCAVALFCATIAVLAAASCSKSGPTTIQGTVNANSAAVESSAAPPTTAPSDNPGAPQQPSVPQKLFGEWYAEGQTALDAMEMDVALTAFTKAIELDPTSASAYNARGVVYLRMKMPNPAIRDFDKAIELSPKTAKFFGNRALVYQEKDENARAIADLTKAIELEPTSEYWFKERGNAYYLIDDTEHAKLDFEAAERLRGGKQPGDNEREADDSMVASDEQPETIGDKLEQSPLFQPLHELTADITEFTRCVDVNLEELRLLINEYAEELATVRPKLDPSRRNATISAYSTAHRMYDDSARVWELQSKVPELLQKAEEKWQEEIRRRAVETGGTADNTDIVNAIAAFKTVINGGHVPSTLYPPWSRRVTGISDVMQRYPELAGEFKGYSYVKSGAIAYLWEKAERTLAPLFPNNPVDVRPAYSSSVAARSKSLAARTTVKLQKQREAAAAEEAKRQQEVDESRAALNAEKRKKAAAGRLRLAKQLIADSKLPQARNYLERLIKQYPETEAAKAAGELLRTIEAD